MQIFFDLDGTLIDVSNRHYDVYCNTVQNFKGNPLPKDRYWELKRKATDWPTILLASGIKNLPKEAFLKPFVRRIEEPNELKKDRLFKGVAAILKRLTSNHVLYLVSLRRSKKNLLQQVEQLGISKYFKEIVVSHTEQAGYKLKEQLIGQVGIKTPACVVGDTEADIKAARSLQLIPIAVVSGIRNRHYLQSLNPQHIINSIAELPALLEKPSST